MSHAIILMLMVGLVSSQQLPHPCNNGTAGNTAPGTNFSAACLSAVGGVSQHDLLVMVDASGKIPSGLLDYSLNSWGSFDECKEVQSSGAVYAMFGLNSSIAKLIGLTLQPGIVPRLGMCLPEPCVADVARFASDHLLLAKIPDQPNPQLIEFGSTMSTGAIFTVVLIALLVVLSFAGSVVTMGGIPGVFELNVSMPSLAAFSLTSNLSALCDTAVRFSATSSLEGFRVLSMQWVVIGHTLMMFEMSGDNLGYLLNKVIPRWTMEPIENGTYSVDSFFVMSGFLLSFVVLRKLESRRQKNLDNGIPVSFLSHLGHMGKLVLHRWLRLVPSLGLVMLVDAQLLGAINDGPGWAANIRPLGGACREYWWTNLLFINNLVPRQIMKECVAQSWYLANDMQFFVFMLPLLFAFTFFAPLRNNRWVSYSIIGMVIVGSVAARMIMVHVYDIKTGKQSIHQNDLYVQPHSRIGTYAVGVLAGMVLRHVLANRKALEKQKALLENSTQDVEGGEYKLAPSAETAALGDEANCTKEIQKSHFRCLCSTRSGIAWIVLLACLGIMAAVLWGLNPYYAHQHQPSKLANLFYQGMSRVAWSIALAVIVLGCALGSLPLVNKMLSVPIFVPLSRLSYGVYVLHLTVLSTMIGALRSPMHYTDSYAVFVYMGVLAISYMLAAALFVLVDLPVAALEAKYLGRE
eukprot:TRINITY_DN742_c0_g1_i1.p1 TRINITY_DN742_c0_g1~~TRINITY_DN742_c0_g1_i1.p1  ORF type:complete len:690 (+),score=130.10 TRINITY_DN742_c0_g1_i1:200-2269(+)